MILLSRIAEPEALTTVTLAELSVGPLVARREHDRAARQAHLQQAETDFTPSPSMPPPPARSDASQPRYANRPANPPHAPTTP